MGHDELEKEQLGEMQRSRVFSLLFLIPQNFKLRLEASFGPTSSTTFPSVFDQANRVFVQS